MDQIRQELSKRLIERVYQDGDWSRKWWMTFVKRNFMNLELTLVSLVSFDSQQTRQFVDSSFLFSIITHMLWNHGLFVKHSNGPHFFEEVIS